MKEHDEFTAGNLTVDVTAETQRNAVSKPSETKPNIRVRRADALGLMAESFLTHGADEMNGADRNQIIVQVSAETLADRTAGCCEIEHGPTANAQDE